MATAKGIWLPRPGSQSKQEYLNKGIDRPGYETKMLRDTYNGTWSGSTVDFLNNQPVNWQNTISSSDSHTSNMSHVWSKDTGTVCNVGAKVKLDNWQPLHIGSVNGLHSVSDAKAASHSPLWGYTGIRFEYRYSTGNYWSNAPIHIAYGMFHYLNVENNVYSSYRIVCDWCSPGNKNLWVDRFASDDARKSDNWKGAYYKLESSASYDAVRRSQLSLVGVSFQIKNSSRGGASHTRSLHIQNLTPIYDDNQPWRPLLLKPRANPYVKKTGNNCLPYEIYKKV